jgi:hypothetical protein
VCGRAQHRASHKVHHNGEHASSRPHHRLLLVQYVAAINADKLKNFVHKMANTKASVGKKNFNLRLAKGPVSDELSGYTHNAVTPIGMKTKVRKVPCMGWLSFCIPCCFYLYLFDSVCLPAKVPIIMSHRIAELQPDFFWMGGGEVDLKVGVPAAKFIEAYKPFIVDCTMD